MFVLDRCRNVTSTGKKYEAGKRVYDSRRLPAGKLRRVASLVETDLQGVPFEKKLITHTYEGIDIQPVYTRQDFPGEDDPQGFPGRLPFVRGGKPLGQVLGGTDLRQQYAHPDIAATNQAILADLAGGVTSLELRFDAATCQGFDPDDAAATELAGTDGVMVYSVDELDSALAGVDLSTIGVALAAGAAFLPAAAMLTALWKRRDVALDEVCGSFNADPLSDLAPKATCLCLRNPR